MSRAFESMVRAVSAAGLALMIGAPTDEAQARKSNFQVLYNFGGYNEDGGTPLGGVVQDAAGNLYGTTVYGGVSGGTVFKFSPDGIESILYAFTYSDGRLPYAGPTIDQAGNLYGTTYAGGDQNCNCGVVYKIDTSGQETVLHTFIGGNDGATPYGGVVRDKAGNLYGTTYNGGGDCNCGVVYKIDTSGQERVLHSFAGGSDGANPAASLLIGSGGNLYGTTENGGSANCDGNGCGTVFRIDRTGTETVLYAFQGWDNNDGENPQSSLIADRSGNLLGTTLYGGGDGNSSNGTVFKLAPDNTESVLYRFSSLNQDGAWPYAGVIADSHGNLYGTTDVGGAYGDGTVFKLTPAGQETKLHDFSASDGANPQSGLLLKKGMLYGTTTGGGTGTYSYGTLFEVRIK